VNFDPFLLWTENTALSRWLVESPSLLAFPAVLTLHAIGMGFAAGISVAFDLRVLGVASQVPFAAMRRFFPVLWAGFWLNAVSGVLLLVAYPTKALTNPVFYLKLVLIAVGMVLMVRMSGDVLRDEAGEAGTPAAPHAASSTMRRVAVLSMLCWAGAVTAGRLLAYTYSRLTQTQTF
jgi:hypothetical protein